MDKEHIKLTMKERDYKYWIVKIEDFVDALSERELNNFFNMLDRYNEFRLPKPTNSYFLINRDEYDFSNAEEFIQALEPHKIKKDGINNS